MIDLHLHSNCSDGTLSPPDLVEAARLAGLTTVAVCDHDTVSGVAAAMHTGRQKGVEVIPGVELSVCYKEFSDIHLLGYWIDLHAPELHERLDTFARRRLDRNREIVTAVNRVLLKEEREPLTVEEVESHAEGVMGRPHIARALLKRGYVSDTADAFNRYLVPCDVPKVYWPLEDALSTIRRIGGLAVLAHPTSITSDQHRLITLVEELRRLGIDGLEVFNSMATEQEITLLLKLARTHELLITAGSDFHGIDPDDRIGKGRGGISFSDALLPPLRKRADMRQAQKASGQHLSL